MTEGDLPTRHLGEEQSLRTEIELDPDSSLQVMQDHFEGVYGRRNNVFLDSRFNRIGFFTIVLGDLQETVRKNGDKSHLEEAHARIISRIFTIAQGINNVPLLKGMMDKYPLEGCAYCHTTPCSCSEKRPDPDLSWGKDSSQQEWSLKNWQEHLDNLYGEKNRERGIEYIINRLFKETTELTSLEFKIPSTSLTRMEIEEEYSQELADCLAWITASANLLNIGLDEAIVERYGKGCSTCEKGSCECGQRDYNQLRI